MVEINFFFKEFVVFMVLLFVVLGVGVYVFGEVGDSIFDPYVSFCGGNCSSNNVTVMVLAGDRVNNNFTYFCDCFTSLSTTTKEKVKK